MNAMNGTTSTFLNCPATNPEILQASRALNNRKAPGKDGVTNEIIQASLPQMCDALNKLFNVILRTDLTPDSWKTGVNIPIYESGYPTNPANYCRITLNRSLGVLFGFVVVVVVVVVVGGLSFCC